MEITVPMQVMLFKTINSVSLINGNHLTEFKEFPELMFFFLPGE